MTGTASWLSWAVLSAAFAALTAIFGKVGVSARRRGARRLLGISLI
jgi:uncharacterized membrane protein